MPTYRYLKGYTLDPSFSTLLSTYTVNEKVYRVRWEDGVEPGPKGDYVAVIDFDPANQCWYRPVDINHVEVLSQNGLSPSEGNPQFHQQFVYTIAMRIIEVFEDALGRKIIWRPRLSEDDTGKYNEEYIPHLKLYPHALLEPNAYYTPDKKSILFGYFKAKDLLQGINVPGGTVFTCLSPDIIAHEMCHAILDSIHPHFIENTNADVGAFHEAFADTIALLERLNNRDLVVHQLAFAKGKLDNESIFGELATQVGQAIDYGHTALRSAIGIQSEDGWERRVPDRTALGNATQVHDRGAIFVACIFDAFIRLYDHRTNDLFRIANPNGSPDRRLHPDLVQRLATEVMEISQNLLKICIQALDFVPPCDITFGDYIRALITADFEMAPEDDGGYRVALIEAFREWGFQIDRVNTMSVDSLRWNPTSEMFDSEFDTLALSIIIENLKPIIRELLGLKDRKNIYEKTKEINAILHGIITKGLDPQKKGENRFASSLTDYYSAYDSQLGSHREKIEQMKEMHNPDWIGFLEKLGLLPTMKHEHRYEGEPIPFNPDFKLQVLNVRPVYRSSREGMRIDQVVVTLLQTMRVEKNGHELDGLKFRGGCTLVFDLSEKSVLNYAIVKRLGSQRRLKAQLEYQLGMDNVYLNQASYMDSDLAFQPLSIQNLHAHE
ncbi:hypothetical protein FK220_001740 [Flavobacteriaceae bacterium TP-CH-4]|uniref:Peptidase M4 n=1 Tax=Pelagihabitans pacificus TaxID=2696054 RepID=A0A967APW8_9FLAO|nr:hypothetical protein [Pelagihabitans pacificus]NHF58044.1 hypothetical protein [Pelagihabitans pacificus]